MAKEVRINKAHRAVWEKGTYPVREPRMALTREWQTVSKLTAELRLISRSTPMQPAICEVRDASSGKERE